MFGSFIASAEGADFTFSPSLYFTRGDYSDSRMSDNFAGYGTLGLDHRCFLSLAYDNILIEHDDFAFRQQMGVAGLFLTSGKWGGKLHYGRILGRFRLHDADDRVRDETDLYSAELLFLRPSCVFGLGYTQQDLTYMIREDEPPPSGNSGIEQRSEQFTGRAEIVLDPRLRLIYQPTYTWVRDGRRLHSMAVKINYLPLQRLLLRGGIAYGERAYFYDNDLFTVYNQHETQRSLWFLRADLTVWRAWELVSEYIDTGFSDYSIRYFVVGVRTTFDW